MHANKERKDLQPRQPSAEYRVHRPYAHVPGPARQERRICPSSYGACTPSSRPINVGHRGAAHKQSSAPELPHPERAVGLQAARPSRWSPNRGIDACNFSDARQGRQGRRCGEAGRGGRGGKKGNSSAVRFVGFLGYARCRLDGDG